MHLSSLHPKEESKCQTILRKKNIDSVSSYDMKKKNSSMLKKRVLSPQVPSSSFPGQITIIPVNHPKPEFRRFWEEILH